MALASTNPMNQLKSKVALTFSATDLPNMDSRSKSDAMVVVWQETAGKKVYLG
jgi:hypothetical protein